MDVMKERQEIEQQIAIYKKKTLWLEYQMLRNVVEGYKNDKNKAATIVNTHTTKIKPLESVIVKAKNEITRLENQKLSAVSIFKYC